MFKTSQEVERQMSVIKSHTVEVLPEEELVKKIERSLIEKKPLRVKLGVDPTAPNLHLGHAVVLRKLKDFQDLGHEAILLIGDYTGLVGDPSGKKITRPILTEDELILNAKTYTDQAFKILDRKKTIVDFNSRWLKPLTFNDVLQLCGKFTVARMLERDDFEQRMREETPIFLHELLYPIMQAYDSVVLKADVEIGGTDQKFNLLAGRNLQPAFGQEPQAIVTMPLLEGLDGVLKMSKSYGNYVGLTESPDEIFGKIMSIGDEMIGRYMELAAYTDLREVEKTLNGIKKGELHPAEVKRCLAEKIVSMYHGENEAKRARAEFDRVFKEKRLPSDIREFIVTLSLLKNEKLWIVRLLKDAGLVSSFGEARRLISQGGVKIDGKVVDNSELEWRPASGQIIQVGKRKFIKLLVEKE